MGQFTKTPDTAPPTVIQAEGVVGGGGVKERGHSAESEISALIQERKEVTRAITEALPAWHPCMPQDTIPIVSWLSPLRKMTLLPLSPLQVESMGLEGLPTHIIWLVIIPFQKLLRHSD